MSVLPAIADTARLLALFPPMVRLALAPPDGPEHDLMDLEAQAAAKMRPARRAEFARGRHAARAALALLGELPASIPMRADRSPQWPPGVVGSITHCEGFCAAAVVRQGDILGLGFDAERADPLSTDLTPLVCTPRERATSVAAPEGARFYGGKLIFSAKEAFYKAYYPLTGVFLDFLDVEVDLVAQSPHSGCFTAAPAAGPYPGADLPVQGRWLVDDGLIFTSALLRR